MHAPNTISKRQRERERERDGEYLYVRMRYNIVLNNTYIYYGIGNHGSNSQHQFTLICQTKTGIWRDVKMNE